MKELETDFLEEYKVVDRICGDEYLSQNGMSEYILQMEEARETGRGFIPSWDGYYRTLKRLRRIRNQIVHDSYGSECSEQDLEDLKAFHKDLISIEDPLALLGKYERRSGSVEDKQVDDASDAPSDEQESESGILFYILFGILAAVAIVFAFCSRSRLLP